MKQSEQEMKEWAQQLNAVHLPRWEELPDIDLYMDQVMTLMDRYLDLLLGQNHEKIITLAMVNNYVKLNLIPAPHKKQYNRVHLAYLVAITILKQVVTIKEVRVGILYQAHLSGTRNAYNLFCSQQEYELKKVAAQIDPQLVSKAQSEPISFDNLALKMASGAFAQKIVAEKAVALQERELKQMQEEHSRSLQK